MRPHRRSAHTALFCLFGALAAAPLAGCGDDPAPATDTATDTGADAPLDLAADATPDATDDGPVGGPRWRRPPGMASVRFTADDRSNQTYGDADLTLVGGFNYDPATNVITITPWTPPGGDVPGVPLYDDGPYVEGGHEGVDAIAGDHVFGCEVFIDNALFRDVEYGVLGVDGEWLWDGEPELVTVVSGETGTVGLPGLVIPAFGDADLEVTLDTTLLHEAFVDAGAGATEVYVRSSGVSWRQVRLLDDGSAGDAAASDGIFTFRLSQHLGPHDGLLRAGEEVQFVFSFGPEDEDAYRLDGDSLTDGVAAASTFADPEGSTFAPEELVLRSEVLGDRLNTAVLVGPDDDLPGGDDPTITGLSPNRGPTRGGTPVLVRGADFARGARVWFDEAEARCQVQGDELITCVTPPHDGGARVPVRVENPDGGSGTNALGFAYDAGLASIDAVTPAFGSAAGGTEVTITGELFGADDPVFFGAVEATSVTFVDASTVRAVAPAAGIDTGSATVAVRVGAGPGAPTLAGAFSYRPDGIDWGRLAGATLRMAAPDEALPAMQVWVFEAGVTNSEDFEGDALIVEVLTAPVGSDAPDEAPDDWEVWPTTFLGRWGDLALYEAADVAPGDTGDLDWVARAALADVIDAPARYIGADGAAEDFAAIAPGAAVVTNGPRVRTVAPPRVPSVDTASAPQLTLSGAGLTDVDEAEVRPAEGGDDTWVSATVTHDGDDLVVVLPTLSGVAARRLGAWDLRLDGDLVLAGAFTVSQVGSPRVDGTLGAAEWPAAWRLAQTDELADWDLNHLDAIYLAYDERGLYLAIEGGLERLGDDDDAGSALLAYLDVDLGAGSGFAALRALDDEDDSAADEDLRLDRALTSDVDASGVPGFGADWAFGTMELTPAVGSEFDDARTGWRRLAAGDLGWFGIEGDGASCTYATSCGDEAVTCVGGDGDDEGGVIEAFLPWCLVSDIGLPPGGLTMGLLARLVSRDGRAASEQVLPVVAGGCIGFECLLADEVATIPVR